MLLQVALQLFITSLQIGAVYILFSLGFPIKNLLSNNPEFSAS